jgi:general secretion pathway protein F
MKFEYRAVNDAGEFRSGQVEAAGLSEATRLLIVDGWCVIQLTPAVAERRTLFEAIDEFTFFNEGLANLTRAGLPLTAAVREIGSGLRKGKFKTSLERVEASLKEGRPLDDALQGKEFPDCYRALVRAGLGSGRLPAVLAGVAVHAQNVRRLRRNIFRAILFPSLVLLFGLTASSALVGSLLPLYAAIDRQWLLPGPSVSGLYAAFVGTGLFFASVGAAWLGFRIAVRGPRGEALLWRLPVLGRLLRALCLERFFASLQIQIESRVPLANAVPVAAAASGSTRLVPEALQRDLEQGRKLGTALGGILPDSVCVKLEDAEKSGRLAETLADLRLRMADESERMSDALLLILEPAATLAIGLTLLGICVAMMRPYLDAVRQLSQVP